VPTAATDFYRGKRRAIGWSVSAPVELLVQQGLAGNATPLPHDLAIGSHFRLKRSPRLSFALGALMLHVAKPFDHVVRTG
jgi:hypothetical protein